MNVEGMIAIAMLWVFTMVMMFKDLNEWRKGR